jgi:hypothetical protein
VCIVSNNSETEAGMQEEREDDVARDEEVEGHHFRAGAEDPPARQDEDSDEDEVEGHRWRYGPEEPGKRF